MDREDTRGASRQGAPVTFVDVAGLFGRLVGLAVALGIAFGLLLTAAAVALPAPAADEEARPRRATAGSFLVRRDADEPWVEAPALATEVSVRVAGVLARASVRQRFRNGTDGPVEGVYVPPLRPAAAVDELRVSVGEQTIEGPLRVVDLEPGAEALAEVAYRETLPFEGGEVTLRLPLAIGPRPARAQRWPDTPVTVEVDLDAGFPVRRIVSRSHAIVSEPLGEGRYRVRLRDPLGPADRDFELAWSAEPGRMPREVVFVIDTSGSMNGPSLERAKRALFVAIDHLRPADRFNVVQFNNDTEVLWAVTRPATPASRSEARGFVERLRAEGGTGTAGALLTALACPGDSILARQVVLVTDGRVADDEALLGLLREQLGRARLFTVGVGAAPPGEFLTRAAELGHGTFTPVGDGRGLPVKMARLVARLESPVPADVETRPARVPGAAVVRPVVVPAPLAPPERRMGMGVRPDDEAWTIAAAAPRAPAPDRALVAVLWLLAAAALRMVAHPEDGERAGSGTSARPSGS